MSVTITRSKGKYGIRSEALRGLFFLLRLHHHFTELHRNCTVLLRAAPVHGDKKAVRLRVPPLPAPYLPAAKRSRATRPPPQALCQPCPGRGGPGQTWHDLILRVPGGPRSRRARPCLIGGEVPGPPRRKQRPTARPGRNSGTAGGARGAAPCALQTAEALRPRGKRPQGL